MILRLRGMEKDLEPQLQSQLAFCAIAHMQAEQHPVL